MGGILRNQRIPEHLPEAIARFKVSLCHSRMHLFPVLLFDRLAIFIDLINLHPSEPILREGKELINDGLA